jgi:hypothetical protein
MRMMNWKVWRRLYTIILSASIPLRSMTGKSADEAVKGFKVEVVSGVQEALRFKTRFASQFTWVTVYSAMVTRPRSSDVVRYG